MDYKKICPYCGDEFETDNLKKRFCHPLHRVAYHNARNMERIKRAKALENNDNVTGAML